MCFCISEFTCQSKISNAKPIMKALATCNFYTTMSSTNRTIRSLILRCMNTDRIENALTCRKHSYKMCFIRRKLMTIECHFIPLIVTLLLCELHKKLNIATFAGGQVETRRKKDVCKSITSPKISIECKNRVSTCRCKWKKCLSLKLMTDYLYLSIRFRFQTENFFEQNHAKTN